MQWVKLDAGFFAHPKALAAGRDGRDLYLAALCWSAGQETDGLVPAHALGLVATLAGVADVDVAASRLVECGLWETDINGWVIHSYDEWQVTRDAKDLWRTKSRERMRKTREAAKDTSGSRVVRANTTRTEREPLPVEVEVDVDTSSSSGDQLSTPQHDPVDDEDEGPKQTADQRAAQALTHVARHLARTAKQPGPYAAAVIRAGVQLDELTQLAALHPGDNAAQLAARWHDQQHHGPSTCQHCQATSHTTERCPIQ